MVNPGQTYGQWSMDNKSTKQEKPNRQSTPRVLSWYAQRAPFRASKRNVLDGYAHLSPLSKLSDLIPMDDLLCKVDNFTCIHGLMGLQSSKEFNERS
mgnify:CR=1 FL=1